MLAALLVATWALSGVGLAQAVAGWLAVCRFARRREAAQAALPAITVLKPLHGDEPLLEEALASVCTQAYPEFQLVCGVGSAADPAAAVVERLKARFPACDIHLVVAAAEHGENGKVSNLINMLPAAKHELLVISDSDVHAAPRYLRAIAAEFADPKCGLVTTLYAGLAADQSLAARLGALAITAYFLPGALLARALGREDCLGATMALRRQTLDTTGGLEALVHHLADDNILGQRVRALGLRIRLADSVCATTVAERTLAALFRHELRWARTIRTLVPASFAASALQYPLAWALVAVLLAPASFAPWAVLLAAWGVRAAVAKGVERRLGPVGGTLATAVPVWLLPWREVLSLAVFVASYVGREVEWRGRVLDTSLDKGGRSSVSEGAGAKTATGGERTRDSWR